MSTVTTAQELAKFLAAEYPDRGATWAMKVVYYVQGWRLAWDGVPAFEDRLEAWDLGPVAPAAYAAYNTYQISLSRPTWSMPEEIIAIAKSVADFYHRFGGASLVNKTHSEAPWANAYGTAPSFNSRGTNPIIEESEMRTYFTQHAALAEERPVRPVASTQADRWDVDICELDKFTEASARRWADALELLSR